MNSSPTPPRTLPSPLLLPPTPGVAVHHRSTGVDDRDSIATQSLHDEAVVPKDLIVNLVGRP